MVLQQKQTTVAYRCPECGSIVLSLVGVFALSADMIRLNVRVDSRRWRSSIRRTKKYA